MKLFLTIFLLCLAVLIFGQSGWINQSSGSTYPGLYGVFALNSSNVWAVGAEGAILHSMDGGENWELLESGTTVLLYTVEFINADTGWVAGEDDNQHSTILRTLDGGETWEAQELQGSGDYVPIWDVDFVPGEAGEPMRGYCTGGLSHTWSTDDYGITWNDLRGNCGEGNFLSCCIADYNTGWFVGTPSATTNYTILFTEDGGENWTEQTNPAEQPLRGVCFADPLRGIAAGLVGTILYTDDGGANWELRPNSGYRWESVYLTETGKAWVAGSDGDIEYSSDWGYTWQLQNSGVDVELWEVFFISDEEGWIVGGGIGSPGVILHTTTSGLISGVDENKTGPKEIACLGQNYPNPVDQSTEFEYTLYAPGNVNLKIYNLLGKEVRTLVQGHQSQGDYKVSLDAASMESGVYFYRLDLGQVNTLSKRLTIVH